MSNTNCTCGGRYDGNGVCEHSKIPTKGGGNMCQYRRDAAREEAQDRMGVCLGTYGVWAANGHHTHGIKF